MQTHVYFYVHLNCIGSEHSYIVTRRTNDYNDSLGAVAKFDLVLEA